jgi:hypothetical protein
VLTAGPPGGIVEYTVTPTVRFLEPLADYWDVHRRPTRIAPGRGGLDDRRLGLRSIVGGEPERLLESGAAFVVVHRDWEGESGEGVTPSVASPRARRLITRNLGRMRREAARLTSDLERRWGPPDARDDWVAIWNLARIRARVDASP